MKKGRQRMLFDCEKRSMHIYEEKYSCKLNVSCNKKLRNNGTFPDLPILEVFPLNKPGMLKFF